CNHNAFANNELVDTRMNMKNSSKQLLLYNSQKPDDLTYIIMFTDINNIVKPK
ncbi:2297_t:CDS:1, partial [Cetraspora pellucida]